MTMTNAQSENIIDGRNPDWGETLDRIRAFIAVRVGDPELAADITQDVFVRSIASGALDQVDNVTAWLYRSARNAVIDHYRTRRIHAPMPDLERWPDPGPSNRLPNRATRELAGCLRPLLGRLSPSARDALTRVDLEGQTHQQAADQLGISVSGMKSRVQRARRQLKDQLTSCCQVQTDRVGAVTDYSTIPGGCGCSDQIAGRPSTHAHECVTA
jgi:RNA polymerase sigma-70 factor, ECF subfamily